MAHKSIHALVIGSNFSNKGAEAMLKTVQQELIKRIPDMHFYMLCRDYEKELALSNNVIPIYDASGAFIKKIKSFLYRAEGKIIKTITGKDKPYAFGFPLKSIRKKCRKVDLVIDISGFAYADSWGKPMIEETLKLMKFLKKDQAKFYFLPQAWGSFDRPEVAAAARKMLSKAQKFYARDLISRDYLAKLMNTGIDSISLVPDIVLNLEAGQKGNNEALMKSIGYTKNGRQLIGISPNLRVYERLTGEGRDNPYIQTLLALVNWCISNVQADIVLIPNEIFPDGVSKPADDRNLCRILYNLLNEPQRCYIVDRYCSAGEIKSFISEFDFLISSRFHALMFGLLHKIPPMAISWSHKYKELFRLFELEKLVLEFNLMNPETAIDLLSMLTRDKDKISEKISVNLAPLQKKVADMFDEIVADAVN